MMAISQLLFGQYHIWDIFGLGLKAKLRKQDKKLTLNACSLTGFSGSDIKGQSIGTTLPLVSARVGNFPPSPPSYVNRLRNLLWMLALWQVFRDQTLMGRVLAQLCHWFLPGCKIVEWLPKHLWQLSWQGGMDLLVCLKFKMFDLSFNMQHWFCKRYETNL